MAAVEILQGPRSIEGKARRERSASKGRHRQRMRLLARAFSKLLRQEWEQRAQVEEAFLRL